MSGHPVTTVGIDGTRFTINGQPTYPGRTFQGRPVEGLLFNVRAVQAIFDDENYPQVTFYDTEVGRRSFVYPDTGTWDPDRNTREFCEAMPSWAAHGIRAVTIGLQGGRPVLNAWRNERRQPVNNTAFEADGLLKLTYARRMRQALAAIDAAGMVAIVNYFYQTGDARLRDDAAIRRAVEEATGWLLDTGFLNIIVDVANESDSPRYSREAMMPARVHELIEQVQSITKGGRRLLVSTSFVHQLPTPAVTACADLTLIHGNNKSPTVHREWVERVRAMREYQARPRPIVFNEANVEVDCLNAAFASYASWGYYDHGANNYHDGFQSPPVNWAINTPEKQAFFSRVREITGV